MNIKIHNPNSVFALKDLPDDDIILARSSLAWGHGTPFRNKMFMLDEMTQQKRYIICNVLQMGWHIICLISDALSLASRVIFIFDTSILD